MRPIFKPQPSFNPTTRHLTSNEDRTPTGYIGDPKEEIDTRSVDKDDPPGRPTPPEQRDTPRRRKFR